MTYIITSNKPNLSVTLHVTANCVLTIAGNNTISNVASSDEILTGAYINQISWACVPGAYLKVLRGPSIAGIYDSSSTHDYSGCGMPLKINSEKSLNFSFLNGSGFCTIELQKIFEPIISTEPDYSLNLDFTNQLFYNVTGYKTFSELITFSRTTNATLVDSTGKVTYAPNNQVTYSEEFDNAAWTKTNSTITANATTAPDGTLTADKHIPGNGFTIGVGASETRVFQSPSATIGVNYVYSMYAKAGEFDQIEFGAIATPTVTAKFSLTLGTVLNGTNAVITPIGDGWYRCSFTVTSGVSGSLAVRWSAFSSTVSVGDGTSGIYAWGSQFEAVTYQTLPSTYNKTVASAYYGPRFDYNPVSLAASGLLIEESRSNLILYSELFDNATWAKDLISANSNVATAPSGTTTADKLIPDNAADLTSIGQGTTRIGATYTANTTHTFSVFAKEAEFDRIQLFFSEGTGTGNRAQVTYSLVDGSVVSAAAVVGTFTNASSTSTSFGNGWYRFALTFTTGTGVSGRARLAVRDSGTTTGDGTSGILLWGAQVEEGAFVTSYIPTGASTATRVTDEAVMTGTNFSNWYNASAGTFIASASVLNTGSRRGVYTASDGTNSNRIYLNIATGGAASHFIATPAGTQADVLIGSIAINTVFRDAFAYSENNASAALDGVLGTTDTAVILPSVNQFRLGARGDNNIPLNGHLRNITYYPIRLTTDQLQALTV